MIIESVPNTIQIEFKSFFDHCRYEKKLSPKTLKAYTTDLLQFSNYLKSLNHPINEVKQISKMDIKGYIEFITSWKPKTIKRKLATIKALFNFLEYEDMILVNPLRKMRIRIKEPKRLPKVMNIEEMSQLLKFAYDSNQLQTNKNTYAYYESLRNTLVLELLFATGARVSEISNLKLEHIDINRGELTLRGKGDKERIIQICNEQTLCFIRLYFKLFKKKIIKSGSYILVNRFGKVLSDQSIRNIVKSIGEDVGIKNHLTPHVFRHTVATLLLENDVDIRYIQSILGHSSISTTQIYTNVNSIKQRQIIETKHPRNLIEVI